MISIFGWQNFAKKWFLRGFCGSVLIAAAGCNGASQTEKAAVTAPHAIVVSQKPKPTPSPTPYALPKYAVGHVMHGVKTQEKVVALTFDDGPQPKYTRQILDILSANKIHATFFMIGVMVKEYPKIAREVLAEGHVVGNHTWRHPSKPKNAVREVQRTNEILKKELGSKPFLFRPPYGLLHNGLADEAKKEGACVVLWSAMGSDWSKKATAASIESAVCKGLTPGGVALLHDGGGNRTATVAALPKIIANLKAKGYRFVTIPELLELGPPQTWSEVHFWKSNGVKKAEKTPAKTQKTSGR